MKENTYVVIMAGGIGSRFWPYSRNAYPKQFLDVLGVGKSLLQLTYYRFLDICDKENIYIVSNRKYESLIKEQLPDLTDDQILLEPNRRNTAPCIAYASYKIAQKNPNAVMVVTPADHAIFMEKLCSETVAKAVDSASKGNRVITLGIKPNRPETGYGYIQYVHDDKNFAKKVKTFTEKPQYDLALKFLESGDFVWNAGIFIWDVPSIIQAFEEHLPDISDAFSAINKFYYTEKEQKHIEEIYSHTKGISIDYGVMEKAGNVFVVLGDFGWSDLGSWSSLHEIRENNGDENVISANSLTYEVKNSLIMSDKKEKLIVVQGLDGYLVADSDDVLLICEKDNEKQFRSFVSDVKNEKGEKYI
jgi:mannose-1-phosphate guanylyltransferase